MPPKTNTKKAATKNSSGRKRRSVKPTSPAGFLRGRASSFFFSSRRRHTRSVSAFLLNRSSDLMASSVRLKPLNCSRLPCVYAQETLTFLLTQKKTCVKNYVQKE